MNNEFVEIPSVIEVYEPPALVGVGDFAEVTLGRPNWGFEPDWSCIMFC